MINTSQASLAPTANVCPCLSERGNYLPGLGKLHRHVDGIAATPAPEIDGNTRLLEALLLRMSL